MKRTLSFILVLFLGFTLLPLSGCSLIRDKNYLVIYNWEEYIDEDLVEDFEKFYRESHPDFAGVRYETFDTNETFYTKATKGREYWDVACPSDYMIGKMAAKGMLAPIDTTKMEHYENLSPYMRNKFHEVVQTAAPELPEEEVYGVGYMWGTMGVLYNTEAVAANRDDHPSYSGLDSWKIMWDSYFDHKVFIKNSMREAFTIGALYAYSDELLQAQKTLSGEEYSDLLFQKLNDVTDGPDGSITAVGNALKAQRTAVNVKYDVDFDKVAMANNTAWLDFCWSGDGNMAIYMGAEQGNELSYAIPDEGTNIFFDGWVMNKDSKNKEAAQAFLDYLCLADSATKNSDYIGYVSCVANADVLDWAISSWTDATEGYEDENGTFVDPTHAHMKDEASGYDDLIEFFGKDRLDGMIEELGISPGDIAVNPVQYPSSDVLDKLAIMATYTDAENDQVLAMWSNVKGGVIPIGLVVLISVIFLALLVLVIFGFVRKIVKSRTEFKKHHFEREYQRLE